MIRGEADLDAMLNTRLKGIKLNTAPVGASEVLVEVPVFNSIPEEDEQPDSLIPGISVIHQFDIDSPVRMRDGMDVLLRADMDDASAGYIKYRRVELRRFYYQVAVFTRLASDLVDLSERVLSRLRRQRDVLVDADGNAIPYWLESVNDFASKIGEERVFKRTLTYFFDAWVLPRIDRENPETVGVVEFINTQIHDANGELSNCWVPATPPSEEP